MYKWAVKRENGVVVDWYPIAFRPECDRTYFDFRTGIDRSLVEVTEELAQSGYSLESTSPYKEIK